MTPDQPQEFLFQYIRELLPQHESLVDSVAEVLHISNDSAYRRIRGETPLVLDEAKRLCSHFNLSLDQVLNIKKDSVLFQTTRLKHNSYSFEQYLGDMLRQMKLIEGFLEKEILYLTKDIPLFHQFNHRPFFAFRYFFWMKSILQHPDYNTRSFSFDCLEPSIIALGESVSKIYSNIASVEIWNTECINSSIFQVEYYKEMGLFSSAADIKAIYDSAEEILSHVKAQVTHGTKFLPGENPQLRKSNFKFFYNRIILGDNTIFVKTDHRKSVHLNFDVLNYMTTTDESFCTDTHEMIQNLIKRSTMISTVSEKQRDMFFNILISKIRDRKHHI